MPQQEIKAVLFDLGDTLLNYGKVNTTRLVLQAARSSYDYIKDQGQPLGSFTGYFLRYLVRLRIHHFLSECTGRDFDALALLAKVGEKEGIHLARQQWEQVIWHWYEPLCAQTQVERDLVETLTRLKDLGLKLGILSNTFVNREALERHMEAVGILDFFSVRLYSYELGMRKPDARIFRIAAEKVGEAFENILFVGDRIDKDIRPALKGGMAAALKNAYTNAGKATPPGAWRISEIAELPDLIQQAATRTLQSAPA